MEPEITIKVFDIVKTPTPEGRHGEHGEPAGDTVRQAIVDNWDKFERIVISFDGIAKMTRVFVDEAFARLLENHTLEEINQKVFFPDAKEMIVKDMNAAFKLRKKILASQRAREEGDI